LNILTSNYSTSNRTSAREEVAMLAPMNEDLARLRRAELREQACRDRQERLALAARTRRWLPRRKRVDSTAC
jgi:hypothetical protein